MKSVGRPCGGADMHGACPYRARVITAFDMGKGYVENWLRGKIFEGYI